MVYLDCGALDAIFCLPFHFSDYKLVQHRGFLCRSIRRVSAFTTPAKFNIKQKCHCRVLFFFFLSAKQSLLIYSYLLPIVPAIVFMGLSYQGAACQ